MLFRYSDNKAYRLRECENGLYNLDVSNPEIIALTTKRGNTDYYFLSTANANMEYFTHA